MQVLRSSLAVPLQPSQLAMNSTRATGLRGVGFSLDSLFSGINSIIGDIREGTAPYTQGSSSGGKDAFDYYRQVLWERFGALTQNFNTDKTAGTLDYATIGRYITELQKIINDHAALYNQYRQSIEASWIDPRYRDLQSTYERTLADWRGQQTSISNLVRTAYNTASPYLSDPWTLLAIAGIGYVVLRRMR